MHRPLLAALSALPLVLPLVLSMTLSGCATDRTYECAIGNSEECKRSGQNGACLASGTNASFGFCAFTDSSCAGEGLRWDSTAGDGLAGQCVNGSGGGDGGTINACGGTTQLEGIPGANCGVCDSGSYACEGQETLRCEGEFVLEQSITSEGSVSASSVFSGSFPIALAVDGDLGTSWFSAGSQVDGAESVYSWIGSSDRCIDSVTFIGNEFHANSQFRENFGFGQLTVEVRGADDVIVFSKVESLAGTPDPEVLVNTGGVMGRSVHMKLQGHESNDCGGFSELTINAKL